jgi:hypothetical protein
MSARLGLNRSLYDLIPEAQPVAADRDRSLLEVNVRPLERGYLTAP